MTLHTALAGLLGALLGSMLFFAAIVAPTVFHALPGDAAGPFLRRLFPRYYLWGLVLALLCTLLAQLAAAPVAVSLGCAVISLLFVYTRQWLVPQINRARDRQLAGDEAATALFRRLHLQSVSINLLQLLLLAAAMAYLLLV